jgi:hypothetical protein
MATEDELQAAADRGELRRDRAQANQQFLQAVAATERRWIVLQVVEVAKANPMSPDDFRDLCNFILEFTAAAPGKSP